MLPKHTWNPDMWLSRSAICRRCIWTHIKMEKKVSGDVTTKTNSYLQPSLLMPGFITIQTETSVQMTSLLLSWRWIHSFRCFKGTCVLYRIYEMNPLSGSEHANHWIRRLLRAAKEEENGENVCFKSAKIKPLRCPRCDSDAACAGG